MKRCLRLLFFLLLRWTGLMMLYRFLHRKEIVILTIHGVMDGRYPSSWEPLRPFLARRKLAEYLGVLSRRYCFVSLMHATEMLQGCRPVQPYSMVLTFDDGYRNNVTHALPILRQFGAPAIFFIPTGFLDHPRPFWFDRLDYAAQHARTEGQELKIGSVRTRLDCSSKETLRESFVGFIRAAQAQDLSDWEFLEEVEKLTVLLEERAGRSLLSIVAEDPWTAIVNWDEINAVISDDISVGSHTVDHMRLGAVDRSTAYDQLHRSKQSIEVRTGSCCRSICYPKGSFCEETVEVAEECGYTCGLTTIEGLNRAGDNPMTLRRIGIGVDWSATELLARVSGLSRALSHIVRGLS